MAAEDLLELDRGSFTLRRHPDRVGSSLRAWDAADLLLLDAAAEHPQPAGRLLLIGDRQGALATVLAPRLRTSVLDRAGARIATANNLERNDLASTDLASTDPTGPDPDATGLTLLDYLQPSALCHDLVLMKLPRANDLLELRLRRLAALAPPGTPVIAGVMARRLSRGAIALFERFLGPVEVSRATRKARLLRAQVGEPHPPVEPATFDGPEGLQLVSWPSVFGAGRVDKGAAALLPHIPSSTRPQHIVDLGCGGGVLGLVAALRAPEAQLTFVDDSALAVDSCRLSWQANAAQLAERDARFLHADDLSGLPNSSVDLVLCNPPFHQEHAVTRQTAAAMFAEARRVLRNDGALLVVGNRHLGYDEGMRRRFGRVRVLASDRLFVVLRGTAG